MLRSMFVKKKENFDLYAFAKGTKVLLEQVPDPVFAEKMMGDGIAIQPIGGSIYAPCDATILFVAPSSHAIGMKLDNGVECLLHLGLDTINLNGTGIVALCQAGDRVNTHQKIALIDDALLHSNVVNMVSMLVFTNLGEYHLNLKAQEELNEQQLILTINK